MVPSDASPAFPIHSAIQNRIFHVPNFLAARHIAQITKFTKENKGKRKRDETRGIIASGCNILYYFTIFPVANLIASIRESISSSPHLVLHLRKPRTDTCNLSINLSSQSLPLRQKFHFNNFSISWEKTRNTRRGRKRFNLTKTRRNDLTGRTQGIARIR